MANNSIFNYEESLGVHEILVSQTASIKEIQSLTSEVEDEQLKKLFQNSLNAKIKRVEELQKFLDKNLN